MNHIIACAGLKPEIELVRNGDEDIRVQYLRQNLHRAPDKLNKKLQGAIDEIPDNEDMTVVLGYGLCSNAVVGVRAPSQGMYIPRVHDCITLYLGNRETYKKEFNQKPGTYYLTSGWINNQTDPLGMMENEYTRRVGRELAEETIKEEIRNYSRISFIHTAGSKNPRYVERAKANATYFGKEFTEFKRDDTYFRKILYGPYEKPDFVYIEPHDKVKQIEFLK